MTLGKKHVDFSTVYIIFPAFDTASLEALHVMGHSASLSMRCWQEVMYIAGVVREEKRLGWNSFLERRCGKNHQEFR